MIIFDGYHYASQREAQLAADVAVFKTQGEKIVIAAVLFAEDKGSQLYTGLKKQAAERVGIEYRIAAFSLTDEPQKVITELHQLNQASEVTGIIIQKPWRRTWAHANANEDPNAYQAWWSALVKELDPAKDVDGLHPETLAAIENGTWTEKQKVMPATAKAVLSILESTNTLTDGKYIIIGKSEILGKPLAYELKNRGLSIELLGKKELDARVADGRLLKDADVVISATGQGKLVQGYMLKQGVVVVDVGEPKPDVERSSLEETDVAAFLTPVPGGVGPVTVVSLLENALYLAEVHKGSHD